MQYKRGSYLLRTTLFFILSCGITTFAYASGQQSTAPETNMTHRMMMLAFQLGTILFAAKLGGIFFERFKIPAVLGEIAMGIIIGPYLLGKLALPGLPHGLFPINGDFPISPELYGFCSIAAIMLLFMVGLETDTKMFLQYSVTGGLVGLGGAIVSFILGDLTAVIFAKMLFGQPISYLSSPALFLGAISTATSVGISARILSDKHKLDSPEGIIILAGAVIDDVIGIIILAVCMGIISASKSSGNIDWKHIGLISMKAIGIWLAATVTGILAAQKIGFILKRFKDRSSIAIMALGLSFILAGLFEEAGLAMIVGAYIMGLSLSGTDINRVVQEKIQPICAFLVPVFFVTMGMLVDVRLLCSRNVLIFGMIYSAVAIIAKIVGCGLPTLFCNFNMRGALRIGVGMLPRGEVALIIAGIGLAAGILTSDVFGVSILMTLITTLLAPQLLLAMFKNEATGIRKQMPDKSSESLNFTFPSVEITSLLLNKLLDTFQAEGFFTHVLDHDENIYQLRKDTIIINLICTDKNISFKCDQHESLFINTAMYEILAELEKTINELKKPIDATGIARKLQDTSALPVKHPAFAKYIHLETLIPQLKGTTKKEIIEELIEIICRNGLANNLDAVREAVWTRENSMSTGMQYGLALPHGKTDAVKKITCAIGLKPEGIDFQSLDGTPSKIFVLLLSPKNSSSPHVKFLSIISQVLNKKGREDLLSCSTPQEMLAVLTEQKITKIK